MSSHHLPFRQKAPEFAAFHFHLALSYRISDTYSHSIALAVFHQGTSKYLSNNTWSRWSTTFHLQFAGFTVTHHVHLISWSTLCTKHHYEEWVLWKRRSLIWNSIIVFVLNFVLVHACRSFLVNLLDTRSLTYETCSQHAFKKQFTCSFTANRASRRFFFFLPVRSIHVGLTFNYSFTLVKDVTSKFKEWVYQKLAVYP